MTDDVDRLTVTFEDPADEFSYTTQTVPFQRGRTVFHRVVLQKEDPPVTFDSSKDLRVPLGHAEGNMAELELPADNLLDKDGKPFKGEYQALYAFKKLRSLVTVTAQNCPRTVFNFFLVVSFSLLSLFLIVAYCLSCYSLGR